MANYMTVVISGGANPNRLYYRKQRGSHPSHNVSGQFTNDAKADYSELYTIPVENISDSGYASNQGKPNRSNAIEI